MKKLRLTVAALFIAAGAFGTYAFTNADAEIKNAESSEDILHWFDGTTYLGPNTKGNIQSNYCGAEGSNVCAEGYESVDASNNPLGDPVDETTRL